MGKIIDYDILWGDDPELVSENMYSAFADGWQPLGPPSVIKFKAEDEHEFPQRIFQAIVKYAE
jgi:hypothetical protein